MAGNTWSFSLLGPQMSAHVILLAQDTVHHPTFRTHVVWQYFPPQPIFQEVSPYHRLPDPVMLFSVLFPPQETQFHRALWCFHHGSRTFFVTARWALWYLAPSATPRIAPVVSRCAECRTNEPHKFLLKDQRLKKHLATYLIISPGRKKVYFLIMKTSDKPQEQRWKKRREK